MKRTASFLVVLLLAANLAACQSPAPSQPGAAATTGSPSGALSTPSASEQVVELRLSHTNPPGGAMGDSCEKMAELVSSATDGRIKINVFHAGQLGGERETAEACQTGSLDFALVNQSVLANFVPQLAAFDLPYVINSTEHADKVFLGDIGKELLESLSAVGIKGIAIWESGFRDLTNSKREVKALADVAGLRIRVMENKIHQELWRKLGADAVPMAWGDAYTALQQGAIDGQENAPNVIENNNILEVNKYLAMTEHIYSTAYIIMAPKTWASLGASDQQSLMRAMDEANLFERELVREINTGAVSRMQEKGMIVTYPDKQEFIKASQPIRDEMGKNYAELLKRVAALD